MTPVDGKGYFEHMELELMVESGLTPLQVLTAATGNAARIMRLDHVGTLQPDNWADFQWGYLQYRFAGAYRIRHGGGGPSLEVRPNQVVAGGAFRFMRNPMCLGHLVFMLGLAITSHLGLPPRSSWSTSAGFIGALCATKQG